MPHEPLLREGEIMATKRIQFFETMIQDKTLLHKKVKRKKKENSLDFDDLLEKATKLLKENEDIRERYQEKWYYIHIDEYQDTNEVQYLMSKLLCGENKNICVVGDDAQSIYAFRGANIQNILNFKQDYPGFGIYKLEQNYRLGCIGLLSNRQHPLHRFHQLHPCQSLPPVKWQNSLPQIPAHLENLHPWLRYCQPICPP